MNEKTYHIYKIKEDRKDNVKMVNEKISKPEIVRIGLVDYIYNETTGEFIPFEEVYQIERRKK